MKQLLKNFFKVDIAMMIVAIVVLVSCQKPHDHLVKTVPLKAEFTTLTTLLQQGPPELDSIAGQGTGTPIGRSSFITHAKFDTDYNLTGMIATTTANGDKFFASITGNAPNIDENGNITLHFDAIINGGTGKFAGASGNFKGVAHESTVKPGGTAIWDGTITY